MKVTKSTIHKLEVSPSCGCVAAGEYEDALYKKQRGTIQFTPCEKHKESAGVDAVEMLLTELVAKEASEVKALPPSRQAQVLPYAPAAEPEATDGNGTPAEAPAESTSAAPAAARSLRPGSHRPAGGGGTRTGGFVRRSDPAASLSANAASKLASPVAASKPAQLDLGDEVPEDHRVTRLLEETNFLDEGEETND